MDNNIINVSVLVLTYNPNIMKFKRTLNSIIKQQNVRYEIIVSDDGSHKYIIQEIENVINSIDLPNIVLNKNNVNVGTVCNCISAVEKAHGEFVYMTSPGDLLYDENSLSNMYQFARNRNAKICFGRAYYYNYVDEKIQIYEKNSRPQRMSMFIQDNKLIRRKIDIMFGDGVLGAAYFRERNLALKYFKSIQGISVYMEDGPSTMFALADGHNIICNPNPFIWYEFGEGISTNKNTNWQNLLSKDLDNTFKKLKNEYPRDSVIDAAYLRHFSPDKIIQKIYRMLKHPIVYLIHCFNKLNPIEYTGRKGCNIDKLREILDIKEF